MSESSLDLTKIDGHPLAELHESTLHGQDAAPVEAILDMAAKASLSCKGIPKYMRIVASSIARVIGARASELRDDRRTNLLQGAVSSLGRCIYQHNEPVTNQLAYNALDKILSLPDSGIDLSHTTQATLGMVRAGFLLDGDQGGPKTARAVDGMVGKTLQLSTTLKAQAKNPELATYLLEREAKALDSSQPDGAFTIAVTDAFGTLHSRPARIVYHAVRASLDKLIIGPTSANGLVALASISAKRRELIGARPANPQTDSKLQA